VLERNFVAHNVQSAFRIGEVRGVVLSAAATHGHAVHEYAPAAVKLAAVGHGAADKQTVMRGVTALLRLQEEEGRAVAFHHRRQAGPLRLPRRPARHTHPEIERILGREHLTAGTSQLGAHQAWRQSPRCQTSGVQLDAQQRLPPSVLSEVVVSHCGSSCGWVERT
jgi:hypothetical protein